MSENRPAGFRTVLAVWCLAAATIGIASALLWHSWRLRIPLPPRGVDVESLSVGLAAALLILAPAIAIARRLGREVAAVASGLDALSVGHKPASLDAGRSAETRRLTGAFERLTTAWSDSLSELRREREWALRLAAAIATSDRYTLSRIRQDSAALCRDLGIDDPRRSRLDSIVRQTGTIEAARRRLLLFAGALRPRRSLVSVNPAVGVCVRALAPAATARGRALLFDPDPNVGAAPLDLDLFHQLLQNLILNALEAAGEPGRVELRTQAMGDRILVAVRDDGPGVASDKLDEIFEPFFTTKEGAAGLGLSISRRIVEAHGGSIRVMNVHPHGLEVDVRLSLRSRDP